MSNLRTPRVIAVLLAFILSGAGLALVLTVGLGGGPATTPGGAVTGSTPTFTTAGDRWTLDEVLRRGAQRRDRRDQRDDPGARASASVRPPRS